MTYHHLGEQNEAGDTYIAACDATASPMFKTEHVDFHDLCDAMSQFIAAANRLDLFKKLLFRGRTPAEINMRPPVVSLCNFDHLDAVADLLHGAIGAATETGELMEMVREIVALGKPADKVNAVEETGDILWYLSRVLKWADVGFADAQRINIDKLHGRHGETFNQARDSDRDLAAERAKLESAIPLIAAIDEANTVHPED